MTCVTKSLLLLSLVILVKGDILNKSFLVRMEDITNTNRELNKTVHEQKEMMADFNSTMENLKARNAEQDESIENLKSTIEALNSTVTDQEETIEALNTTLAMMQDMQNGGPIPLV